MKIDKKNYVKQAEDIIKSLSKDKNDKIVLTTSQIRNLLTLTNEIYNAMQLHNDKCLSDDIISLAQYVKMRIAYNAGRDRNVKDFVTKSKIMDYIDAAGNSREEMMLVCHYMEALVAYHKYYRGERD